MKRAINKAPFSKGMFNAPPSHKTNMRNRFALSIRSRCKAELKQCHKKYKGDIHKVKKDMPKIVSAIIMCYKGYCGSSCQKYSLVCNGQFHNAKAYMPANCKIKMTVSDEAVLKSCINMLLGPDSIEKTKLLTSTQKCEAVNRAYQFATPKLMNFARNSTGRIHSTILKLNLGYADSVLLKSEKTGAPLKRGSSVIRFLRRTEQRAARLKSQQYKLRARQSRYATRKRRFSLHSNLHYAKGMADPKPDFSAIPHLSDHCYSS
jgi:hypothetical protein